MSHNDRILRLGTALDSQSLMFTSYIFKYMLNSANNNNLNARSLYYTLY